MTLAAVLMVDYYALRAGEGGWLVRLAEEWGDDRQLGWLPNIAYSAAFARRDACLASPISR